MASIPISVRYMFLSAFCFALMGACVKAAHFRGIPVLEILAARALISCGLSYFDIRKKNISPWGNNRKLLIARGTIGTFALVCVFYAVTVLPLAEATLLQYLYPVFTSLLALVFLREKVSRATIVCIALCLLGLFVMIQPGFILGSFTTNFQSLSTTGVAAALIGSLGTACAYVIIRKLSTTEDPSVIIFYFPFIALPVSCLLLGNNFVMPTGSTWLLLIMVGVFTQIAQFGLTMAIKTEKAAKATAYSYIQVIFSGILGWMFFQEMPTINTYLGGLFIISGALINVWFQSSVEKER